MIYQQYKQPPSKSVTNNISHLKPTYRATHITDIHYTNTTITINGKVKKKNIDFPSKRCVFAIDDHTTEHCIMLVAMLKYMGLSTTRFEFRGMSDEIGEFIHILTGSQHSGSTYFTTVLTQAGFG